MLLGTSVRSLAQSCHRLKTDSQSLSIWAIDQFADLDCIEASDKVSQLDLDDVSLDMFGDEAKLGSSKLLFMPGGGTENHSELAERIGANYFWCGVVGSPLRSLRDPEILFQLAHQVGLQAPLTYTHKTHPDRQSFAQLQNELGKNPQWLWKSSDKGGGLGVSDLRSEAELAYFFSARASGYLQERIEGSPYGATIIISANGSAEFVGASRLLTASEQVEEIEIIKDHDRHWAKAVHTSPLPRTDYPYLFAGAIGPCLLPPDVITKLKQLAELAHSNFGIKGWFQVDFILDALEQAWILEVNPRWSATMEIYERSMGISLSAAHLRAWGIEVADTNANGIGTTEVCWKDVVYAQSDFLWHVGHQRSVEALNATQISKNKWPLIADIPNGQQSFAPNMPVFSLIASGPNQKELAVQRLRAQSILAEQLPQS